jgi:hypothetical protein
MLFRSTDPSSDLALAKQRIEERASRSKLSKYSTLQLPTSIADQDPNPDPSENQ